MTHAQSSQAPTVVWTPAEMAQLARPAGSSVLLSILLRESTRDRIERSADLRDVQSTQDRFRRCYLGNGVSLSLCRCMAHVEPHLHSPRKVTRIGHLPLFTMKELPE